MKKESKISTRKALIEYSFLSKSFYEGIKNEIYNIDLAKLSGGRSSLDLSEEETKGLPFINDFNDVYTNSEDFWVDLCTTFSIDMPGNFREDYIEPKNGLIDEKDHFSYGRMDIGFGLEGYGAVNGGRGNHIDKFNRVISCLLYFSDQSDFEGGQFCFTNKEGEVDQIINIDENLLIASVQDANGWHKVMPVTKVRKPRVALYFALSTSYRHWKR